MADVLNVFDYIAIGIVLLLSASFGLYFRFTGGRQKTTREFLMGDRSMGIIPVSFSLMATSYSAVTILGIPAETYLYGLQRIVADLGYPIGLLLASYLIVPVYFDTEVTTIYQVRDVVATVLYFSNGLEIWQLSFIKSINYKQMHVDGEE